MSKWALEFTPEAQSDFDKLDRAIQKHVTEKLDWLQVNFNNIIPSALSGEWQGYFKLRIGDWRIIYKVNWEKNLIVIYVIDHRSRVYKRRH